MTDTQKFKILLENEKVTLEDELKDIGKKSDTNPDDWDVVKKEDVDTAEDAKVTGELEEQESASGEIDQLEAQLKGVNDALKKIDGGSYGKCEVCGKEIENDRLEANPSARTCKSHMD